MVWSKKGFGNKIIFPTIFVIEFSLSFGTQMPFHRQARNRYMKPYDENNTDNTNNIDHIDFGFCATKKEN